MTALLLEDVVVGRKGFFVGPFTLRAEPGHLVALLGPNGGGKTTLLDTIAGLIPPMAGSFTLPEGGTLALLPAPGAIDAPFSALHMVMLGGARNMRWKASFGGSERAVAQLALDRLGIGALAAKPFDRLSSGQKQLVMLARTTLQDTVLCLLDEPTAMLDPAQSAGVETAIKGLAQAGRIVLFATHDVALARQADIVLTVGTEPVVGEPRGVLTDQQLSQLYGRAIKSCATCGHSIAETIAASRIE